MSYRYLLLCCTLLVSILSAQDDYHSSLRSELMNDYGLPAGSWLTPDTESATLAAVSSYGNVARSTITVTDQAISSAHRIQVNTAGPDPWSAGWLLSNEGNVNAAHRVLLVVWLRAPGGGSANLFVENAVTYAKEVYLPVTLDATWQRYLVPFESTASYPVGALSIGLHLGTQIQTLEVGGLALINYGTAAALDDLPSALGNDRYGGYEPDAAWRAEATTRIDSLRKADLQITVRGQGGVVAPGISVQAKMLEHEYGFGTAVVGCRMPENSCYDADYVAKLLDLDGAGHRFNTVVFENALKWRAWEYNWIGTKAEKTHATQWLREQGMTVRGHVLVWPGESYLPDDIVANLNNPNYVIDRVEGHLAEILDYPGLDGQIYEWDVLNEITYNRAFENALAGTAGYPTGREVYPEIFQKAKQLAPEARLYINDYVTISQDRSEGEIYDRYQNFIQEIIDAGAPLEGIGFQAHIGAYPVAIDKVYDILDDFHQRFGLPAKITEYDIDKLVEPDLAARYLRDFLTITFSHPSTDGFLMWGFWDGNHWLENAPLFNLDWSIKPSGQAFLDLVFDEWWTDETHQTDATGRAAVRGFKGRYELVTDCGSEIRRDTVALSADLDLRIDCPNLLVGIRDFSTAGLRVYPNPARTRFVLEQAAPMEGQLDLYNATGQRIAHWRVAAQRTELPLNVPPGVYWLQWRSAGITYQHRLVVQ